MKLIVRVSLVLLALLGFAGPGPIRGTVVAGPQDPTGAPPATPGIDPLLEFVPKEHVPADSAVSFPVDI